MSVDSITFPVPFEEIPAEVLRLQTLMANRLADYELARKLLTMVRSGCNHENAKTGYNERDGAWMNPCPHCGASS